MYILLSKYAILIVKLYAKLHGLFSMCKTCCDITRLTKEEFLYKFRFYVRSTLVYTVRDNEFNDFIIQLKYTIAGVSKIPAIVSASPWEIGLLEGNWNLAYSRHGIL